MDLPEIFEHFFSSGDGEKQDHRRALIALIGWILKQQEKINERLDKIMASIDDVVKDVTDESTLIDGVSTMITSLQTQLAAALAGTTLPPAVQAKVDAVFTTAEANKGKLATALASGTPAAAVTPGATP